MAISLGILTQHFQTNPCASIETRIFSASCWWNCSSRSALEALEIAWLDVQEMASLQYICICIHTYVYIYIYTHTYVYIYTHTYVYIYIYMYMYIYIYIRNFVCFEQWYTPKINSRSLQTKSSFLAIISSLDVLISGARTWILKVAPCTTQNMWVCLKMSCTPKANG